MSAFGSAFYQLLQVNTLRALVGNLRIFVRTRIRILPVVRSADPQIRILPVAMAAIFAPHQTFKNVR